MNKKLLFFLTFDHRSSFLKNIFQIKNHNPSQKEIEKIKEFKKIIYQGFRLVVDKNEIPNASFAIILDEQFGQEIIKDGITRGYKVGLAVEKSGQNEFEFEWGENFENQIKKYRVNFVKALVRYNPEDDKELKARQRKKLKQLSDFCQNNNYQLIIEPLVPATPEQLKSFSGNKNDYDLKLRPKLIKRVIVEMKKEGIRPALWKIEGLETPNDYRSLVKTIKSGGNKEVNVLILGRGANDAQVKRWLKAGASVKGVTGFAIGRTIFQQPLIDYQEKKIVKKRAIEKISQNYKNFCDFFLQKS